MTKNDRLWARYWGIRDDHRTGHWLPIIRHLAFAGDAMAMTEWSDTFDKAGRIAHRFSQSGLAYAAYRRGNPTGAQHLAMNAFNRGDLQCYRRWLWKAAKLGDSDAARELRRFETRLPHAAAGLVGRKRPYRRSDLA